MKTLTGFEFVAADEGVQIVVLKRKGEIIAQYVFCRFIGVDLTHQEDLLFEKPEDLTFEGVGIGKPFWDMEPMSWTDAFNPRFETQRVETILSAARRVARSASLSL